MNQNGESLYLPGFSPLADASGPKAQKLAREANALDGLAALVGRFLMIVPILALAGSMAAKRRVAPSLGTFPTTGVLWSVLLIGVVVIVGALTFFPALSLGPIVEQLLQNAGKVF